MTIRVDTQGNIDLSDPQLVEQLMELDVNKAEAASTVEEKEIQELEQLPDEVKVKLSLEQVALLQREARTLNINWLDHLNNLIQENIFVKRVGRSIIRSASYHSETISAPSGTVRTLSANALAKETPS